MGNNSSKTEVLKLKEGRLVSKHKEQFNCSCCEEWLVKPVQSLNGHRFCKPCLLVMQRGQGSCNICKEEGKSLDCSKLKETAFFADRAFIFDRNKEVVKCLDCGFKGMYKEYKKVHADGPCKEGTEKFCYCF